MRTKKTMKKGINSDTNNQITDENFKVKYENLKILYDYKIQEIKTLTELTSQKDKKLLEQKNNQENKHKAKLYELDIKSKDTKDHSYFQKELQLKK